MKKIVDSTQKMAGIFFLFTIVVLGAFYLRWVQLTPPAKYALTAGDDAAGDYVFGFVLLIIYVVLAVLLKFIKNHLIVRAFLSVLTMLFLCINGFYIFHFIPSVEDTANCNKVTYYLTYHPHSLANDWSYYQLSRWDWSFKNETLFSEYAIWPNEIICDEKTNEVRLFGFNNHLLFFTDGVESYWYDAGYHITFNNHSYQLASYDLRDTRKYVMAICRGETADTCQINPVDHSSPVAQDESHSLILDTSTNELYLIFDGEIYFSYGHETRKFHNLTSKKYYYNIASYQSNNAYFYVLYVCPSEDACDYVPFSYSTPTLENANIVIDRAAKSADTLSVYIDDKLIFTYNGLDDDPWCNSGCLDSQCHIEGCLIPKPQPGT